MFFCAFLRSSFPFIRTSLSRMEISYPNSKGRTKNSVVKVARESSTPILSGWQIRMRKDGKSSFFA